jgi:predicted ATP-dependent serine protease
MVVIDSLQKAYIEGVGGMPGSSLQCAEVARYVMEWCNETDIAVFMIVQVTKDGSMAGPIAAQHDFDTVIEFDPRPELDSSGEIRPKTKGYVRMMSDKNRYGERGLFEMFNMTEEGLVPLESNLLRFSSR